MQLVRNINQKQGHNFFNDRYQQNNMKINTEIYTLD